MSILLMSRLTIPINLAMSVPSRIGLLAIIGVALLVISGCENTTEPSVGKAVRHPSPAVIKQGGQIYLHYCAECHGKDGEGADNWRVRGQDGFYPPPPLNGSGHAWHHPESVLHQIIKEGSPVGQGHMPRWGGRLSDQEIDSVIVWFQSLWPDQVHQAWYRMEQKHR